MCISLIPPTAFTRKNSVTQVSSFTSLPFPPLFRKAREKRLHAYRILASPESKPWTKSLTRHCGISFWRFVVTTPRFQASLCHSCYRFDIVMSFHPVICIMACRRVIVSFHHIIIISLLLHFVFAYQPSWPGNDTDNAQHGSDGAEYKIRWVKGFHPLEYSTNLEWGKQQCYAGKRWYWLFVCYDSRHLVTFKEKMVAKLKNVVTK